MNQLLKQGQKVTTESSVGECVVDQFIGGGGQGEVYRAQLHGSAVAVKWYFPTQATAEQRSALEMLVKKGPPTERFLWPLDLVSSPRTAGFGYVMPLREEHYKGIVDLMKRRIEPSFRALSTAGFGLSHHFLQLHSKGLCYRDISFGNVFFDPVTGDVLICDNDNVAIDGGDKGGVLGTPRFMAPEVVRGDALPSTQTDLFSLAVLLFYMFVVHHPLEGKHESEIRCFDLPAMTRLYGTHPLFIFDPTDDSNRPVKGYHDNAIAFWKVYPKFFRELFTRAFTAGIRDPQNGRVRESEWRAAMLRLRDSIVYCAHCASENFYDDENVRAGSAGKCWSCQTDLRLPFRMKVGNHIVMLNHDTKLFPYHLGGGGNWDFSRPSAEVTQHPTNKSLWGLKNLSLSKWITFLADGKVLEVEPTRSVTLLAGTRIQFGQAEGEIRSS